MNKIQFSDDPQETRIRTGTFWRDEDNDTLFILANVLGGKAALVCLHDGYSYIPPVGVSDTGAIDSVEWEQITAGDEFTRVTQPFTVIPENITI